MHWGEMRNPHNPHPPSRAPTAPTPDMSLLQGEQATTVLDAVPHTAFPLWPPFRGEGGLNGPHASQAGEVTDKGFHPHFKGKKAGLGGDGPSFAQNLFQKEAQFQTVAWRMSPFSPAFSLM